MKTLKDVKVGEHAVIQKLHGEGALKRRCLLIWIHWRGHCRRVSRCFCATVCRPHAILLHRGRF